MGATGIDIERVAWVLLDAMDGPGKAAAVARETVQALLAGGMTIDNPNMIALERTAIRLDEITEQVATGMDAIETKNGWTVIGTVTSETDAQVMIRVKSAHHGGQDCTSRVRPNMVISKDNIRTRA